MSLWRKVILRNWKYETVDDPGSSCVHILFFHACPNPVCKPSESCMLSPYMEENMATDQGPNNRSLTSHVLCSHSLTLPAKNFLSSLLILCLDTKDLSETTHAMSLLCSLFPVFSEIPLLRRLNQASLPSKPWVLPRAPASLSAIMSLLGLLNLLCCVCCSFSLGSWLSAELW